MMNECWDWPGSVDRWGYAHSKVGSRTDGSRRSVLVHRAVYEALVGPIPTGLTIDHLCRNPRCYNPTHLEAVTMRENTLRSDGPTARNARKQECPKCGGPLTPKRSGDGRDCDSCRLDYFRMYNAARRPACSRKIGVR